MVPKAGFEPARAKRPLPPQDSVSANSTTSARIYFLSEFGLSVKPLDAGGFAFCGAAGTVGICLIEGVVILWAER